MSQTTYPLANGAMHALPKPATQTTEASVQILTTTHADVLIYGEKDLRMLRDAIDVAVAFYPKEDRPSILPTVKLTLPMPPVKPPRTEERHTFNRMIAEMIDEAVNDEREACAKICEESRDLHGAHGNDACSRTADRLMKDIRSRNSQTGGA